MKGNKAIRKVIQDIRTGKGTLSGIFFVLFVSALLFEVIGFTNEHRDRYSVSVNIQSVVNHDINKFEYDQIKNPESFYWPAYFLK